MSAPLSIAVNGLPLTGLMTGIGRYVRALYGAMTADAAPLYFDGKRLLSKMPEPAAAGLHWARSSGILDRLPAGLVAAGRALRFRLHEARFRSLLRRSPAQVYHETAFFPMAVRGAVPVVFTLYDLSMSRWRQFHPPDRLRYFDSLFPSRLAQAHTIVAISEAIRTEAIAYLGWPEDRIVAIPLAADPVFAPPPVAEIARIRAERKLPERFLLFVGTMEPRKNLALILRAMAEARPGSPLAETPLVCAGWSGWLNDEFNALASSAGMRSRIHTVGRVSDRDLVALYGAAAAFVFPSHYEGFGLPVLEAMACGCPVVVSTDPALVEVAGDAAPAVPPGDPAALAAALDPILADLAHRSALVARGTARAAEFSWARTARETLAVLRRVAGGAA